MRRLLRSETIKLHSARSFAGLLAALLVLELATVVIPVAAAPLHTGRFAMAGEFAQRTVACAGATAAGVIALILGVLGLAGEYRHGTLTPTLLATPRRGRVVAAKSLVHAAAGGLIGAAASLLSVAVLLVGLHLRGVADTLSAADLAAIIGGGILYVMLAALLGLGVGAAVRDPVVALAGILTLFFVVENILVGVAPNVARWLPGQTGSALAFPAGTSGNTGLVGAHVITQAAGGATFAAYTAVALLTGALLTRHRDIT